MVQVGVIQRLFPPADLVGDFNIAHGGEGGQQIELLKNKANPVLAQFCAFAVVEGRKVYAVDDYAAVCGPCEPAEQVKESGLSRARRTHDGHELSGLHGKRHTVYRGDRDSARHVNFAQVFSNNDRRRRF